MKNRLYGFYMCALIFCTALTGCATVDSRWQDASAENTVTAYEEFLKQHPDSQYETEAKNQIESLYWREAAPGKSYQAIDNYLRTYPNGKYTSEAKELLEKIIWENAKRFNTYSAYEGYIRRYPDGAYSSQAQIEIKNFANVVIDFPDRLKSQDYYFNISGPVWVFRIVFRETNGVAATIQKKKMRIRAGGKVWGDYGHESIYHSEATNQGVVEIKIPAGGTGSYTAWVNSPKCTLCGGTMSLDYIGTDANGHTISVSKSFLLEK